MHNSDATSTSSYLTSKDLTNQAIQPKLGGQMASPHSLNLILIEPDLNLAQSLYVDIRSIGHHIQHYRTIRQVISALEEKKEHIDGLIFAWPNGATSVTLFLRKQNGFLL